MRTGKGRRFFLTLAPSPVTFKAWSFGGGGDAPGIHSSLRTSSRMLFEPSIGWAAMGVIGREEGENDRARPVGVDDRVGEPVGGSGLARRRNTLLDCMWRARMSKHGHSFRKVRWDGASLPFETSGACTFLGKRAAWVTKIVHLPAHAAHFCPTLSPLASGRLKMGRDERRAVSRAADGSTSSACRSWLCHRFSPPFRFVGWWERLKGTRRRARSKRHARAWLVRLPALGPPHSGDAPHLRPFRHDVILIGLAAFGRLVSCRFGRPVSAFGAAAFFSFS